MNKKWNTPVIEELDVSETQNNIVVSSESDGIYAGDLGNNPDGFVCQLSCS